MHCTLLKTAMEADRGEGDSWTRAVRYMVDGWPKVHVPDQ